MWIRLLRSMRAPAAAHFSIILLSAWATNPNLRVTLIGHSAGAIYVQRFLEALDARAPNDRSRQSKSSRWQRR